MNSNINLAMNKNPLLKSCRFYRGEPSNPYDGKDQNKAMLWSYEQMWVQRAERGLSPADSDTLEDYDAYGLKSFSADDGVPVSLKAFLFNRFMHWQGGYGRETDLDAFKKFYLHRYLEQ